MPATLENEHFLLTLCDDGSISLMDRKGDVEWRSDAPFRFTYGDFYSYNIAEHAKMKVKVVGSAMAVSFSCFDWWSRFAGHSYRKPDPGPDFRFSFKIELRGDEILFTTGRINGIDGEECRIEFPHSLLSWSVSEKAEAILPWGYGQLVDYPREDEHFQFDWGYFGMPLHGVFRKGGGIGVRLLDPCDSRNSLCSGVQEGVASIETAHLFNRRFANYPRRILWKRFATGSGFLALAKWYRGERIAEGKFVSLAEKIREFPDIEKLAGAVIWKHSVYSQRNMPDGINKEFSMYAVCKEVEAVEGKPDRWNAYELFDKAHGMGFDRLCVFNTGWNRFGYDSGYPTRFPVNPERGTEEDFKKAAEYARSLSKDYIYSVHDNYCDVYRNSPEEFSKSLRIAADGAPVRGGIWRGGRAWIQCTCAAMSYARRDIPRIAKMVGRGGIYIDVLGSSSLSECHSQLHPASRRKDLANRRRLMSFIRKTMGSLASEAIPCDATVDLVDLGAYMSSAIESPFPRHIRKAVAIPLWQLVYHDSLFCFTNAYSGYSTLNYHAFCALFGLLPGGLDKTSLLLSRRLREAYCAEMTSFRFLSEPKPPYSYAAESRFADGTRVIANMTDEPLSLDGLRIPPHSFEILS